MAKVGLDGHDVGAKVVARALRDAGMEVIYTGLRQTPEAVARAAVEEDVDVVGLSILSGSHMALIPEVLRLLREEGGRALVVVGGVIPPADAEALKGLGVAEVFCQGASTDEMVEFIRSKISDVRYQTSDAQYRTV